MPNTDEHNLARSLHTEVRVQQEKLIGTRAYELARDALDNEILLRQQEIRTLLEFQRDDLTTTIRRLELDGTVLYDTIGESLHETALDLDRRLASVAALSRQSERMHFADDLVPA